MTKKRMDYKVTMLFSIEYDDEKETAMDAAEKDLFGRYPDLIEGRPQIEVYEDEEEEEESEWYDNEE